MSPDATPERDPAALLRRLIACPSVTPADAGALDVVAEQLAALGFTVWHLPFQADGTQPVDNIYARLGTGRPNLCFAGHTDVVPPGDQAAWTQPPFAGAAAQGYLWGRGAVDMKGGIAAFLAALADYLATRPAPDGAISLLITGDEEGPGTNGTAAVVDWLQAQGEPVDAVLLGEPTNPATLGDAVKIGRRGSLNAELVVQGRQGHAAYPHRAANPLPRLAAIAGHLADLTLDTGSAHFEPSTLALTALETGNQALNVIPGAATCRFNVRFNDHHTGAALEARLAEAVAAANHAAGGGAYELTTRVSAEAFVTEPGPFVDLVRDAVAAVTGRRPALSTAGGTSDARHLKALAPVVEFGLVGATMHAVDERVRLDDLTALTQIYDTILRRYFAA